MDQICNGRYLADGFRLSSNQPSASKRTFSALLIPIGVQENREDWVSMIIPLEQLDGYKSLERAAAPYMGETTE